MTEAYLPVTADDANRQQQTARAFYLVGDFFKGVDSVLRMEPGNTGAGMMGPGQSGIDVGLGGGGELYVRGRAGQIAATQQAPAPAAGLAGMLGNPLVLVALAVGAYLLLRRA